MSIKNNTSHTKNSLFFDIIDERKDLSANSYSVIFLSDIPKDIVLPYDKFNNSPRLKDSSSQYLVIDQNHIYEIAKNRQQKFESRISWYQGVKENQEQQTSLNEQQIELETRRNNEDNKKDIEDKLKNIEELRKKLNKERLQLDKMQKEDKRSIAIEELMAIRKYKSYDEKYHPSKTTKLSNRTERSA